MKTHQNFGSTHPTFGSVMEGRSFVGDTSGWYRFGFGGQEKDDEISGKGNLYSAEFWEYDARVGRRWNVDPKTSLASGWTPYRVYLNNPIVFIDPDGQFEIKGSTSGDTRDDRRRNRQEKRFLKQIVKSLKKEMKGWDNEDWAFIKDNTGMNKKEYLKMFKNGNGPELQFTDISKRSNGLMNGDNNGNAIKGDRYAEANAERILLDEGLLQVYKDLEQSKSGNAEHNSLKHPGLKFGPKSGFTRTTFLKNEHSELLKFSTLILGHEAQHSGADIKGLPATRSIVPYATDERGELYELHFYGDVKGHQDFGFGVYNAFEARKFLPGQQNREEEFKTNSEAFWNSKYGK